MNKLVLNKGNVLDLLDCINAWISKYGYENMRPEMKELTNNLLNLLEDLEEEKHEI